MSNILQQIREKKEILDAYQPLPEALAKQIIRWTLIEFAFSSNVIEGGSLSRAEIAQVIEKKVTVGGKNLEEQTEAVRNAQVIEWIMKSSHLKIYDINENFLISLHHFPSVEEESSKGFLKYSYQVPYVLTEYIEWLHQQSGSKVEIAVRASLKLLESRPFDQETVRTSLLLLNVLLVQSNYPVVFIREEQQLSYRAAVQTAINTGSTEELASILFDAILFTLTNSVAMVEKKDTLASPLLKIGELAKLTNETIPTIRHWTKEQLLEVAEYSKGGYQLYELSQADVVIKIRELQRKERMTIKEIKDVIKTSSVNLQSTS